MFGKRCIFRFEFFLDLYPTLDCIHNELFDAPNADELILDVAEPPGDDRPTTKPPKDTPPYLRSLYLTPLLTPDQERDLFRRYNYLKHKTARLIDQVDPEEAGAEQFAALSELVAGVDDVKQRLTRANLRLVVAIAKKRLGLPQSLYTILQILSLTLFEKVPLEQMLANCNYKDEEYDMDNQLNLFGNLTGQ